MRVYVLLFLSAVALVGFSEASQLECEFFPNFDQPYVTCNAGGQTIKCDTQGVTLASSVLYSDLPGGKLGRYRIGTLYERGEKKTPWMNLYPSRDKGGFWDYSSRSPERGCSGGYGFHPGSTSLGCITVKDNACWDKIEAEAKKLSDSAQTFTVNECGTVACNNPFQGCGSSTLTRKYIGEVIVHEYKSPSAGEIEMPKDAPGTYIKIKSCTSFSDASSPYFMCKAGGTEKSTNAAKKQGSMNVFDPPQGFGIFYRDMPKKCVTCTLNNQVDYWPDSTGLGSFQMCQSTGMKFSTVTVSKAGAKQGTCQVLYVPNVQDKAPTPDDNKPDDNKPDDNKPDDNKPDDNKADCEMVWPATGHVSRAFRSQKWPSHNGIDIAHSGGAIYAAKAGTVGIVAAGCPNKQQNGCNGGAGNYVEVKHADGTMTRYLHLKEKAMVNTGEQVKQGQQLGWMGTSGHSTGTHLHFEIRDGHKFKDPALEPCGAKRLHCPPLFDSNRNSRGVKTQALSCNGNLGGGGVDDDNNDDPNDGDDNGDDNKPADGKCTYKGKWASSHGNVAGSGACLPQASSQQCGESLGFFGNTHTGQAKGCSATEQCCAQVSCSYSGKDYYCMKDTFCSGVGGVPVSSKSGAKGCNPYDADIKCCQLSDEKLKQLKDKNPCAHASEVTLDSMKSQFHTKCAVASFESARTKLCSGECASLVGDVMTLKKGCQDADAALFKRYEEDFLWSVDQVQSFCASQESNEVLDAIKQLETVKVSSTVCSAMPLSIFNSLGDNPSLPAGCKTVPESPKKTSQSYCDLPQCKSWMVQLHHVYQKCSSDVSSYASSSVGGSLQPRFMSERNPLSALSNLMSQYKDVCSPGEHRDEGIVGGFITRENIQRRATAYMGKRYNAATGSPDGIDPDDASRGRPYDTGCTGLVSMAFRLERTVRSTNPDWKTKVCDPALYNLGVKSKEARAAIKLGDALHDPTPPPGEPSGHILLFHEWDTASAKQADGVGHQKFWAYECSGGPGKLCGHKNVPYPYWPNHDPNGYHVCRYVNVIEDDGRVHDAARSCSSRGCDVAVDANLNTATDNDEGNEDN